MSGSPGDVSEDPVTEEKRKKGWRMSCDVGEATEGLEQEHILRFFIICKLYNYVPSIMGGSPGDVSEEPVTQEKRKKGSRMSCDVREATEGLENEL